MARMPSPKSFLFGCCWTEEANVTHERFTRAQFRETDDSRRNQERGTAMRRRRRKNLWWGRQVERSSSSSGREMKNFGEHQSWLSRVDDRWKTKKNYIKNPFFSTWIQQSTWMYTAARSTGTKYERWDRKEGKKRKKRKNNRLDGAQNVRELIRSVVEEVVVVVVVGTIDSLFAGNERKVTYDLLLGTAQKILVHFRAQIAWVAVAPHQVVNMGLPKIKIKKTIAN